MTKITYLHELIAEEEERLIAEAVAEREAEDAAWAALTPEEREAAFKARKAAWGDPDELPEQDEEDDWYGDDEEEDEDDCYGEEEEA